MLDRDSTMGALRYSTSALAMELLHEFAETGY
jgi:hypothetical protein